MIIGKIIGNIVSTIKHKVYEGKKILIVQPINADGNNYGDSFLAVDFTYAGIGDRVMVVKEGSSARQLFEDDSAPVHAVIVGIVDRIDTGEILK